MSTYKSDPLNYGGGLYSKFDDERTDDQLEPGGRLNGFQCTAILVKCVETVSGCYQRRPSVWYGSG